MFGLDLKKQIEKIMMSDEYDEMISHVMHKKLQVELKREGDCLSCVVHYGDYMIYESPDVDIS